MVKVLKFKLFSLLSDDLLKIIIPVLFLVLNFRSLSFLNVLIPGGKHFNPEVKYELILNNYVIYILIFGLFAAIYIGSSIIGPDLASGNIYVILTSYSSRRKYFMAALLSGILFLFIVQVLLLINLLLIFFIFDVAFLWSDLTLVFFGGVLNSFVTLVFTSVFSVFIKGHNSAVFGLLAYVYFNLYTFNQIPFINTSLMYDLVRYKDLLSNLFPIQALYVPSFTEISVYEFYILSPVISNIYIYQSIYIILLSIVGSSIFKFKDL